MSSVAEAEWAGGGCVARAEAEAEGGRLQVLA
jgi:hypothetical protein